MDARVIDDPAAVDELEKPWRHLFAESASTNPFLTWEYFCLWLRHHGDGHEPRVVVVEDDAGDIVGVAPLVRRPGSVRTLWQPVMAFPGQDTFADYADVLALRAPHEVVGAVLDALHARDDWGVLHVARVPGDSPTLGGFALHARGNGRRGTVTLRDLSPWVAIDGDHDAYYEARSTGLKRKVRKGTRKLTERLGETRYETCRGAGLDAAWRAFDAYHQDRQQGKEGTSVAASAEGRAFLDELVRLRPAGWQPEVGALWAGNHPVAVTLNLQAGRRQHGWLMGFDDGISGVSLGRILTHHIVEDAFARELAAYDMMVGTERYKFQWATGVRPSWDVVFHRQARVQWTERRVNGARDTMRRVAHRSGAGAQVWRRLSKLRA